MRVADRALCLGIIVRASWHRNYQSLSCSTI